MSEGRVTVVVGRMVRLQGEKRWTTKSRASRYFIVTMHFTVHRCLQAV